MFKIVVAVAFFTVVASFPQHGHEEKYVDYHSHPKYEFKYGVEDKHTHDIKSAGETRDGDVVKGFYSLVEPDGTVRKVEYTVDKHSGFNAVVTRTGHASHAAPAVYKAAPVAYHSAPAVAVQQPAASHHVPVVAVHQAAPAYKASAPVAQHGHATSYSSFVSHHVPVQHGHQ